jgi:hypothetical protein
MGGAVVASWPWWREGRRREGLGRRERRHGAHRGLSSGGGRPEEVCRRAAWSSNGLQRRMAGAEAIPARKWLEQVGKVVGKVEEEVGEAIAETIEEGRGVASVLRPVA